MRGDSLAKMAGGAPPSHPKIYHITHVDNLAAIVQAGEILSDSRMLEANSGCTVVGMSGIKRRRIMELEVSCHTGTKVGDYVPFYFCPRSIMLYILYKGNHLDLEYHGGQRPIVHLQADLRAVVCWADAHNVRWAFSDRNAGTYFTGFYNRLDDLDKINWPAVASTDFRNRDGKEGKQAEFLVYQSFPWDLVETMGVIDERTAEQAKEALSNAERRPTIRIKPDWYYY